MALINCPECKASVSDRADACIKCGFPLSSHLLEEEDDEALKEFLKALNGDFNFDIGDQVVNWGGNAAIKGEAAIEHGDLGQLEPGKMQILRHKKGIKIINSAWSIDKGYSISFKQILQVKLIPAEEVIRKDKSVIGRGIVGGVLLGGTAAVVGALSALDKSKLQKIMITEIYFYQPEIEQVRTFVFRSERAPSMAFFRKVEQGIQAQIIAN